MMVLKWICFILVCLDTVVYIAKTPNRVENIGGLIGFLAGIAARVYVLYGTATCWLLV